MAYEEAVKRGAQAMARSIMRRREEMPGQRVAVWFDEKRVSITPSRGTRYDFQVMTNKKMLGLYDEYCPHEWLEDDLIAFGLADDSH